MTAPARRPTIEEDLADLVLRTMHQPPQPDRPARLVLLVGEELYDDLLKNPGIFHAGDPWSFRAEAGELHATLRVIRTPVYPVAPPLVAGAYAWRLLLDPGIARPATNGRPQP